MGALELIAWSGNSAEFPENTLPAVVSALDLGADGVAIDAQVSSDEIAVSTALSQVATGGGHSAKARVALRALDAADICATAAADPTRFGDRHAEVRIPTLASVARLFLDLPERAESPPAQLVVNVQDASIDAFGADRALRAVLAAIAPLGKRATLLASDLVTADRARKLGAASIGWRVTSLDTHAQIKCEAICPDHVFCDVTTLLRVDRLWRGPWRWHALNVEGPAALDALEERGVRGIATRRARGMQRELRMWRARRAAARAAAAPR